MTAVSPLREIERTVQRRAKHESLDMSDLRAEQRLRTLIAEALADWSADHQRGLRPFDLSDRAGVSDRVFRNLAGYGPLEPLLTDPDVWEIMVNGPTDLFVKRHNGTSGYHDEVFHDDDHVVRTLTKILDDAAGSHRKLDPAAGLQDAQLPDGARLHIIHGELSRGGHVLVNIRKFTGVPFASLADLVERGSLSEPVAELLRACVQARASIVFAGPPGTCCYANFNGVFWPKDAIAYKRLDLAVSKTFKIPYLLPGNDHGFDVNWGGFAREKIKAFLAAHG